MERVVQVLYFVSAGLFVVVVAGESGLQVVQQAHPFWGIVVTLLVLLFGMLAFARIFVIKR